MKEISAAPTPTGRRPFRALGRRILLAAVLLSTGLSPVEAAPLGPSTVSPGGLRHPSTLGARCPTFSWARVAGAESILLEVDRDTGGSQGSEEKVFEQFLPGAASSFTPALDRCFDGQEIYSWRIRARVAGREQVSESRRFRVAVPRGLRNLQEKLGKAYEPAIASTPEVKRGEHEAEVPSPAAKEPSSAMAAQVRVDSAGASAGGVNVYQAVQATDYQGIGIEVTNVTAANIECSGCLTSSDLANGSVGASPLADGAVESFDLADNSLTSADFGVGSVDSNALSGVDSADIAANAVGVAELNDGAVNGFHLTVKAVAVECDGECSDGTLGELCDLAGAGWHPIFASSPHDVPSGTSTVCGGDNVCRSLGDLARDGTIDTVCPDGGGWDCLVFCVAP